MVTLCFEMCSLVSNHHSNFLAVCLFSFKFSIFVISFLLIFLRDDWTCYTLFCSITFLGLLIELSGRRHVKWTVLSKIPRQEQALEHIMGVHGYLVD